MNLINDVGNLLTYKNLHAIAHQANCQNVFGSGIAAQIKKKYFEAFLADTEAKKKGENILGNISVGCHVFNNPIKEKYIINIYGQNLYGTDTRKTNYEAVYSGLLKTRNFLEKNDIEEIGFPKLMSCGLGGGSWKIVSSMIEDVFEIWTGTVYIVEYN